MAELAPLLAVAVKVLFPVLRDDERTFKNGPVPTFVEFKDQVTAQLESFGTTPKDVDVVPTPDTRGVVTPGLEDVIAQLEFTPTVQEHSVESRPSEIRALIVLFPTNPEFGVKMA